MNFILKSIITFIFIYSSNVFASEKMFNVVINEPSSDKRSIAFVDTVTKKNRILEVNKGDCWEWNFPNKLVSKVKSICNGADINYLKSTDEFLTSYQRGAFIVGRDGKHRFYQGQ